MKTNNFKQNLSKELNKLKGLEEIINYLDKNNAFTQTFKNKIDLETESEVSLINNKITIDLTSNKILTPYDSDEDLKDKMKTFIRNEEYEKAKILKNYFDLIDIN